MSNNNTAIIAGLELLIDQIETPGDYPIAPNNDIEGCVVIFTPVDGQVAKVYEFGTTMTDLRTAQIVGQAILKKSLGL